jgi:hypothetical protein
MNAALRMSVLIALAAGTVGAPARAAEATPPPEFVVTVQAQGEAVNARIVADGKAESAFVKLGSKITFAFAVTPAKYEFAITGCGHTQTRTLLVPPGHPGAVITVHKGCALTIGGR